MKKFCYAFLFACFIIPEGYSQESEIPIIKAEVDETQIMFKRTIWRRMDLREKQNRPFFSRNGEISRLLVEAVNDGLLKPYMSDSCKNLMPDEVFQANTSVERQGGGGGGGFDSGFGGGFGDETAQTTQSDGPQRDPIPPDVFDVIYLKEDVIFDRNRSRMYWYIRAVSIALPARAGSVYNPAGFENKVAHFRYEDIVNLFRGPYADRAIWYNNQNQAAHRNYGDAFELRLFSAPIVQRSNAQNLDIRQIVADQGGDLYDAVLLQQKYEYQLMEYESELWEY